MDDMLRDLCLHRLRRAKEVKEEAEWMIGKGHYCAANNRCYYSVYYAMKAVLALEKIDFKRHKDVIAYFNQNYVKSEVFPRDLGKRISQLQIIREKSDYNDFYFASKDEAETQLLTAVYMLDLTENYLKSKGVL